MPLKQLIPGTEGFAAGEPDVQRTSFSLDVLGRFICNTYDEATTNADFDVIVIGSGMYGGYCAAKLYSESAVTGRTPLRILVLEAGPFVVHEHSHNIPDLGLSNPFRPVTDTFSPEAGSTLRGPQTATFSSTMPARTSTTPTRGRRPSGFTCAKRRRSWPISSAP